MSAVGSRYQATASEDWEDFIHAVVTVIFGVCKCPVNPVTNPNPIYIHVITWQVVSEVGLETTSRQVTIWVFCHRNEGRLEACLSTLRTFLCWTCNTLCTRLHSRFLFSSDWRDQSEEYRIYLGICLSADQEPWQASISRHRGPVKIRTTIHPESWFLIVTTSI
jgi:hypothetical protein